MIARSVSCTPDVLTLPVSITRLIAALVGAALLGAASGCAGLQRQAAPSLDEVIRMSEQGTSDEQIIAQLSDSRAIYPLTASRIVELHQKGVTTAVLDHMQQAYIENIRTRERMMYSYPYWGYYGPGCAFPYGRSSIYWGYRY